MKKEEWNSWSSYMQWDWLIRNKNLIRNVDLLPNKTGVWLKKDANCEDEENDDYHELKSSLGMTDGVIDLLSALNIMTS